ncbi:hypothetical protein BU24DRAFT_443383 [Aaosphaeria arxii CBS 175.79]|uniref:Oxidoreductase-like protein n=1 Tax=Aaosphaeria arxii CBS 175.79 TaxID=1450172 RepID=A0A6A5XGR2_9PLEO|nr:uncharacterized protein BU24DRAFT_443383 [Aaosphaeria arxii CBS 175.79]KAF2012049.1 hypothetical protein BU24DRAFT_443383 [Aaosphaeria arxii CBS 175.79]
MSAPAIEAKSLSSLTTLASNPPSYPRNPTHVRHEPLVLYIARVPGSRDVFLSPMKPRDRVVTAEDIQSSLYFVHIEQPEDVRFINPFPGSSAASPRAESPNLGSTPNFQRRPAPGGLVSPLTASAPKRKPVPGTLAPQSLNVRNDSQDAQLSPHQANLLSPDYHQRRSFDSSRHQETQRPSPPYSPFDQSTESGTSLTLIRRDPGSGAQWNVARIADPHMSEVSSFSSNELSSKRKTATPFHVEIHNPGYSKFLHSNPQSPLISRPTSSSLRPNSQGGAHPMPPTPQFPNSPNSENADGIFRRRIWMENSKYGSSDSGHRKHNSYDANAGYQSNRGSVEWPNDRSSMDLRPPPSPSYLTRDDTYDSIPAAEKQSPFRGYVFMTPWNSRCEFVTGTGGGSLKCRHIVPGLQGNPPTPMPVSELRFNLPSASRDESKRSSIFHRPRHSRNNSSVSEMDLSLGQEFAGGGFGGRQAKLGKLIIEDEGLKMLDLLVAANIALWWRAYEKV